MRIIRVFGVLARTGLLTKSFPLSTMTYLTNNVPNLKRCVSSTLPLKYRSTREGEGFENEIDLELIERYRVEIEQINARDLLYKSTRDVLLKRITNCVSVQELFNVLNYNIADFNCEHVTQSVLVLWDLKKHYLDYNSVNASNTVKASNEFMDKLKESESFKKLLDLVESKAVFFDTNTLSFLVLYLNKLGLMVEDPLMQSLILQLKKLLLNKFSLAPASRFLETVFSDVQLKSYLISQEIAPFIFKKIETCCTVEDLNDLTLSLNMLHNLVTSELLENYKSKVDLFLNKNLLKPQDHRVILKIIALLNYPKWRDKNTVLMARSIFRLKNHVHLLNVNELILLYDIFFKIQEPGELLSELQRCASKYLQQLDEDPLITSQKIALFSSLVFFSSPNHRREFQKSLNKFVDGCNDLDNLILLRKILSSVKISDTKLCHIYWSKISKLLTENSDSIDSSTILFLCQSYANFNIDIENFRHVEFEAQLLDKLQTLAFDLNFVYYPQKLANIFSFVLIYGSDMMFLEFLVDKLETHWHQLKHNDCLKLALTLRLFNNLEHKYLKNRHANRISRMLNKAIERESKLQDETMWRIGSLVKSVIFKSNANVQLIDNLLVNYKNVKHISSKNIENIVYCFNSTNCLIPEVLDRVADYIVEYKHHVLGFNVEKFLYSCYSLGYNPKNPLFFQTATDVMIRDQDRMGGLALIHSGLALCFFNKLPNSIIRSIFNVEFLDKLDCELQNCYSKEKYPQRVRNNLMQLNRGVCLDYPETNVPWFHKKYIDDLIKNKERKNRVFPRRVKETLYKIGAAKESITENVITHYGYDIDFVIDLDETEEGDATQKVAILLLPQYAFTRMCVQMRGKFQMKIRHLEMLGYRVVRISFSDWIGLFYNEERIDFLTNLVWPKSKKANR